MNQDAINEALKRRNMGALDITILLGNNSNPASIQPQGTENEMAVNEDPNAEDDEESRELDQAPKGSDVGQMTTDQNMAMANGNVDQDKALLEQSLGKLGVTRGSMLGRNKAKALSTTEV